MVVPKESQGQLQGGQRTYNTLMVQQTHADNLHSFGASLSYASSDGKAGAADSQILEDAMLDDGDEIILLSDKSCKDSGCGYTRPGGVAYREIACVNLQQ